MYRCPGSRIYLQATHPSGGNQLSTAHAIAKMDPTLLRAFKSQGTSFFLQHNQSTNHPITHSNREVPS